MKVYKNYFKHAENYMKKHPMFNSSVHALGGVAVGILITHPFADPHPLLWAAGFAVLSVLGHLYAGTQK